MGLLHPASALAQLQELKVTPITHDGPIPVFRDYPNLAAIFIKSSLTNLSFESNLEIVEERGDPASGEYILLIEPVRQSIRVNAPGFMQGRIQLQNLAERDVVYYSVEPITEKTIPVNLRVEPPDADVRVDGEPVDISTSIQLEEGTHAVEVTADGYQKLLREIHVDQQNSFFEFQLQELEPVPVRIKTNPIGATVSIEGVEIGQTDRNGVIEFYQLPGKISLSISSSGFSTLQQTIEITENSSNEFSFLLDRNTGILSIDVEPNDANIFINRQSYDPSQNIYLPPSSYKLEVMHDGYDTYSEIITLSKNQVHEKDIKLERQFGELFYSSSPTSAQAILINSKGDTINVWSGLKRFNNIGVGNYRLIVSEKGYNSFQDTIRIEKNRRIEKRITLQEETQNNVLLGCPSILKDIDGNEYSTIQIGGQCWMAENLRTGKYSNGDPIPVLNSSNEWQDINSGASAILYNEEKNIEIYGKLYNWYSVTDSRNVCPDKWTVPTDKDWEILETYLGMKEDEINEMGVRGLEENIGGKMKQSGADLWNPPNTGATNSSGFSGLPGGLRLSSGPYANIGKNGYWWSSTDLSVDTAIRRELVSNNEGIVLKNVDKNSGLSIRCIFKSTLNSTNQ